MYCILVAGVPATGKGRMAQELSQRLGLPWLSKDAIKEKLYDTVGFRCRAEKVALGEGALEALYYTAGQLLQAGVSCILENTTLRKSPSRGCWLCWSAASARR